MCKIVAKLSIFSQPAKKKFIFLSKNSYIMPFFRLFMPFFMLFLPKAATFEIVTSVLASVHFQPVHRPTGH